jgi:tripartite-type tricarboxylate transporter receptor subunit TctC
MLKARIAALALIVAAFAPWPAQAQTYPTKPVKLVVTYPPGGLTDVFARLISDKLGKALGQPVLVDNRPGGNTIVGTQAVVQAEPDGHTLLMAVAPLSVNHTLVEKLPYDYKKDLAPVIQLGDSYGVVAVHPSFPAKTLAELVEKAKKEPGRIPVALPGVGSSYRIVLEQLSEATGAKFQLVFYKGSSQSVMDVVAGHVPVSFDSLVALAPQIKSGSLRALAVLSSTRAPDLPDTPTTAEAGMPPDVVMHGYIGVMAPAGTPRPIIDQLNAAIEKILKEPDTIENARKSGLRLAGGSPEQFRAVMDKTTEVYAHVIKAANIKSE